MGKFKDGMPTEHHIYGTQIGTREIVGFGWNGLPSYADRSDFPLPAIRWREETPEITVIICKPLTFRFFENQQMFACSSFDKKKKETGKN